MSVMRSRLSSFETVLSSFINSHSTFRVVRTVNGSSESATGAVKTLYILDSSFNPPSIAHLSLATSALRSAKPDDFPCRLLLLFSTHNADKVANHEGFASRLAMMVSFAEDMGQRIHTSSAAADSLRSVAIDIGLTKVPYYTDKSAAIAESQPLVYPSRPTHVHLLGYDTLIRLLAPRYYPNHNPPLSALAPYFDAGHRFRATERPSDSGDSSSSSFGTTAEQAAFLDRLRAGELEEAGFEKDWADQLELVPGKEGVGVSSTRVRDAAKRGDWEVVGQLCTPGVAAWVKETRLYSSHDD